MVVGVCFCVVSWFMFLFMFGITHFMNMIFHIVAYLHIYLSSVFTIISSEWGVLENCQVWPWTY